MEIDMKRTYRRKLDLTLKLGTAMLQVKKYGKCKYNLP